MREYTYQIEEILKLDESPSQDPKSEVSNWTAEPRVLSPIQDFGFRICDGLSSNFKIFSAPACTGHPPAFSASGNAVLLCATMFCCARRREGEWALTPVPPMWLNPRLCVTAALPISSSSRVFKSGRKTKG